MFKQLLLKYSVAYLLASFALLTIIAFPLSWFIKGKWPSWIQLVTIVLVQYSASLIGFWIRFKPLFKFMESDNTHTPNTNHVSELIQDVVLKVSDTAEVLKQSGYIITYSDSGNGIIKLREPFKIFSWGTAAVLVADSAHSNIRVSTYPLSMNSAKQAKKLCTDISTLIKTLNGKQ